MHASLLKESDHDKKPWDKINESINYRKCNRIPILFHIRNYLIRDFGDFCIIFSHGYKETRTETVLGIWVFSVYACLWKMWDISNALE